MTYTNSSLATVKLLSPNHSGTRTHAIDTITIHIAVAQWTARRICEHFSKASRGASCNYAIGYDGSIGLCVEEKNRSWCSSSSTNDQRAITIEVASDTVKPYKITDKAYEALINLCADICERNNIEELKWKADKSLIGQVDKQNMTVHRWFATKSCPGDYLYNLHGDIAKRVNQKLNSAKAENVQNIKSYKVKVICDSLNIRKTPKWANSDVVGAIKDRGTYTIVAETNIEGTKFGKLKSGKGWISLGSKYVKKV